MSTIRKTKVSGILIESGPSTFSGELLRRKDLISILDPICSLEIRDPGCLTEKTEVEEAIKHEYPEASDIRIGITVVEVPEQ